MQEDSSHVKVEKGPNGKRVFLGKSFPGVYFTVRESEIASLLEGHKYTEVAEKLALSRRTVEFYAMNMKNKLHCQTRHQLLDLLRDSRVLEQLEQI